MEKSQQPREHNEEEAEEPTIIEIPDNFKNIICDFTNDLTLTFPEYSYLWKKWTSPDISYEEIKELFEYVLKVYPERFFDILYQNDEIFKVDNETNTLFLPNVEFKMIFNCKDISDTTKNAIWKYLQIILFSITNSIKNKNIFGNASSLFDGIDEGDLHNKLQETMSSIGSFFENLQSNLNMDADADDDEDNQETMDNKDQDDSYVHVDAEESTGNPMAGFEKMFENIPGMDSFKKTFDFKNMSQNIPKPEELHEHLKGLFDGKIGTLAKEMAEEITNDLTGILGEDYADVKTTQDVFKKLIKNPKKMMDLVKTIGGKLEKKMKSGDLNQEEIMKEASDIFGKMKGMGGENAGFDEIIKNLAKQMGGFGKNAKMNTGAMNTMIKKHSYMEKMKMKLEKKKEMVAMIQSQQQQQQQALHYNVIEKDANNYVFSIQNETQEKSYITPEKSVDELMNDLQLTNDAPAPLKKSKKSKKGKK